MRILTNIWDVTWESMWPVRGSRDRAQLLNQIDRQQEVDHDRNPHYATGNWIFPQPLPWLFRGDVQDLTGRIGPNIRQSFDLRGRQYGTRNHAGSGQGQGLFRGSAFFLPTPGVRQGKSVLSPVFPPPEFHRNPKAVPQQKNKTVFTRIPELTYLTIVLQLKTGS